MGYLALSADCGTGNTAMGSHSLMPATGISNTALGYLAGYSVTSGSNNIFVGYEAGRTGSPGGNITTGSNEIVLGDENITESHIQVDKWDKRSKYGDKTSEGYDLNAQTPDGTHKEDWLDIGFKAQEVEALEIAAGYNKSSKTNLVSSHTGDGKQMGLQYSKFVPILVKAIQEQQTLIESLTARITTLEG